MEADPGDATPFLPTAPLLEGAARRRRLLPRLPPLATRHADGLRRGPAQGARDARRKVPGDREDREGRPFVGPAGGELDSALQAAGIDRASTYVTMVVKHFKFEERGKRRIHKRPDARAIKACRPWFDAELDVIRPEALVILGATAGKALLGSRFRLTDQRGRPLESDLAPLVLATIHPSAILRERDSDARRRARAALVDDLCSAAALLAGSDAA